VLGAPVMASSTLPAPATASELRTTSDRELADTYLRLGDPDNAARVYEQHLAKHPGDAQALRGMGLAQIAAGRLTDGVEQIQRAYRVDPSLAGRPVTPQDVFAGPEDFQRVLDLTTRTANGSNSASAWLASAVMLQADGRNGPARSALERAKSAGLDASIYDWFRGVLPDVQQPAAAPVSTPPPVTPTRSP
jgi:tetratricopeptide (TPR) repeat protein